MRAPHFVRFCRTLALLSSTPLAVGACSSTGDTTQTSDAKGDTVSTYDGHPVGTLPCDGGCGVADDTGPVGEAGGGVKPYDAGEDTSDDTAYDGGPAGVSIDAGPDWGGGGGGPQSLPDLPFLG